MSRSGYIYDGDSELFNFWRGAVHRATKGKRGQAFLREMLAALDAMPEKRLIADEIETKSGEVCAIGAVAKMRGMENVAENIDPEDPQMVAKTFGIAFSLAAEIVYMNDEYFEEETPEERWQRMREWVVDQIEKEKA